MSLKPIIHTTADCSKCCAPESTSPIAQPENRPDLVSRALRLEYLTVAWNVVEGSVAVTAAMLAGSVAILGFGIDSFVECASAIVMIWRLRAERDRRMSREQLEATENRARRLVAGSLFLLAAYVMLDAAGTLWTGDRPSFSSVGAALLALSIGVMLWLARAKRMLARELGSEGSRGRCFPNDGVLVAIHRCTRRCRSQWTVRLVVGRSCCRPRDRDTCRARRARSLARQALLLRRVRSIK